jgi:hypothetical protein
MSGQFFDDLAKGLDDGTITRRQALRLVGGAALGAALMPILPKQAEALTRKARRRCRRKGGIPLEKGECHCGTTCNHPIHCQNNPGCTCVTTTENTGFCGKGALCATHCTTSADCPGNARCTTTSSCCGPNVCVAPCS